MMDFKEGDIVETNYTNITNTVGKVIVIHKTAVTIMGMLGEVSHHKKTRLTLITNDEEDR